MGFILKESIVHFFLILIKTNLKNYMVHSVFMKIILSTHGVDKALHLWINLEIIKYPQVLLHNAQWIGRVCKCLKCRVNSLFEIMKLQVKEVC